MRRKLKQLGYDFSYVFGPDVTPEADRGYVDDKGKGRKTVGSLLHLHGLIRSKAGVPIFSAQLLSRLWDEIHGAKIVNLGEVKGIEKVEKYIVKHMIKECPAEFGYRGRLLMSQYWMPKVWALVRNMLMKYAGFCLQDHVTAPWGHVNDLYKAWCLGSRIMVSLPEGGCVM
ncbi:hypothetical protein ACFLWB_00620 [Chloroflexota bacterium]